jgi:hypothetical protein
LPVPTIKRDRNVLPAMISVSLIVLDAFCHQCT